MNANRIYLRLSAFIGGSSFFFSVVFAVPSWFSSFVFSLALLATLAIKQTPVPFSGR